MPVQGSEEGDSRDGLWEQNVHTEGDPAHAEQGALGRSCVRPELGGSMQAPILQTLPQGCAQGSAL